MVDWNAVAAANTERTLAEARLRNAQANELGMPQAPAAPAATAAQTETPKTGPATPAPTDEQRRFDYGIRDVETPTLSRLGIGGIGSSGLSAFDITGPRLGAKKGIARVPGKGDGKKDTVPAMLAPGEAVLNKSAADGMGRGLIAALNKMGAQKMGLV